MLLKMSMSVLSASQLLKRIQQVAHFIAFFLLLPRSFPLIIPQEHVAMIFEVHVMHVTLRVERSEPQRKSLPIEIVTNQRDALYAPPK